MIVGFVLTEGMQLGVRWLPPLVAVGMILQHVLEVLRRGLVVRKALARLRSCFSQAAEPDLSAIFSALEGAETQIPISTARQWSERYQRGMITKAEYYSGMRQFLQDSASLPNK